MSARRLKRLKVGVDELEREDSGFLNVCFCGALTKSVSVESGLSS